MGFALTQVGPKRPSLTETIDVRRRALLFAGGALALSACATKPIGVYEASEVAAPAWAPGETWTWARTDAFTKLPAGVLTRRIEARVADEIRVEESFGNGALYSDSLYSTPGILLAGTLSDFGPLVGRRFDPALPLYSFPLASGKRWQSSGYRYDLMGFRQWITLSAQVEGWETIDVLGRAQRAIAIRRSFNLGSPDPFRGPVYRYEREWYAPALQGPVRMYSEEYILTRGRGAFHQEPGYRYDLVLTATNV